VDDTAEYLSFRLRRSGADRELFSHESVAALHELASGSLRGSTASPPPPCATPPAASASSSTATSSSTSPKP